MTTGRRRALVCCAFAAVAFVSTPPDAPMSALSLSTSLAAQAQRSDQAPTPGQPAQSRVARGRVGRLGGPPTPPNPELMTAVEVEQYFDDYVRFQAQTQLRLTDDQFLRFGPRLRALQMLRRQQERQRVMGIRQLNQLLNAPSPDETQIAAKVKELDDLAAENYRQIRGAYAALDQSMDVRQRARFRVFEEMMERRKLELMARARQLAAPAQQRGQTPAPVGQ